MVEVAVSRRAVVRSERYMEWQRELIRTSSTHGARKRSEESSESPVAASKSCVIKKSGSDEQAECEDTFAAANGNEGGCNGNRVKSGGSSKQQQQQQQPQPQQQQEHQQQASKRLNGKRLRETLSEGASRMRRSKQDDEDDEEEEEELQHHKDDTGVRRTQRRVTNQENNSDRNFRFLTRSRGVSPPLPATDAGATTKASKRSKRVAQRLANEEPPAPPLKLPKLHLVLSRKEIQEDWVKITGHKYAGKPKKSTLVQRGFGLCTSLTCPSSIRYLNDAQ